MFTFDERRLLSFRGVPEEVFLFVNWPGLKLVVSGQQLLGVPYL